MVSTSFLVGLEGGDVFDKVLRWAICFAIAIGICENAEVHTGDRATGGDDGMENVELISDGEEATGIIHLGKNAVFVCLAIVIGVYELDDAPFV